MKGWKYGFPTPCSVCNTPSWVNGICPRYNFHIKDGEEEDEYITRMIQEHPDQPEYSTVSMSTFLEVYGHLLWQEMCGRQGIK